MSTISDFLEALEPNLDTDSVAPTKATRGSMAMSFYPDGIMEIWFRDCLVFQGQFNSQDSNVERLIWGRGFHGCSIGKYEETQWAAKLSGVVGRGDTPELATETMVNGLFPTIKTLDITIPGIGDLVQAQYSITTPALTSEDGPTKMAGATTATVTQNLVHSDNRLTNDTGQTVELYMWASVSVDIGGDTELEAFFAVDGTEILGSRSVMQRAVGAGDLCVNLSLAYNVTLANGSFVEVFLDKSGSGDYTAAEAPVIARGAVV